MVVRFVISILIIGFRASSFAQCAIDFQLFLPPSIKLSKIEIGSNIRFAVTNHTVSQWEKQYKKYFYIREGEKEEIKHPEKIRDGFFLFENKMYGITDAKGILLFQNVNGLSEENFVENGNLNHQLEQVVDVEKLKEVNFKVINVTDDYLLLNSSVGQYVYYCSPEFRTSRFMSPIDSSEMFIREERTKQFLDKNIRIGYITATVSGRIVEIIVAPYKTTIVLETSSSFNEWDITTELDHWSIIDEDCFLDQISADTTKSDYSTFGTEVPANAGTTNTNTVNTNEGKSSTSNRVYYTGPKGGCYYINSSGTKTYVDRSLCY